MAVYVDDYRAGFGNMKMSHMVADTEAELHEMADKIGLKRSWYQDRHYDVSESKRELAIKHGAVPVTSTEAAKIRRGMK